MLLGLISDLRASKKSASSSLLRNPQRESPAPSNTSNASL